MLSNDRMTAKALRSPSWSFAVAAVTVALAAAMTQVLRPWLGPAVFPFFFTAVTVTAWYGGLRPGILAIGLAVGLALAFFLNPRLGPRFSIDPLGLRRCALFAGVSGLICVLSEARMRAEVRERRQRLWLEGTLAGIGDAVISTDARGQVTYMNAVAETLTGWNRPAAVGQPLAQVYRTIEESSRAEAECQVDRVFREGAVVIRSGPILLVARDGREVSIEENAAPIRGDRGELVGIVLVFRDTTARKKAERELAESESRFRVFMDRSPIIAFVKDEEGRYVWGNEAWAKQHRGRVADPVGRTDLDLWPEETARLFQASDLAALSNEATSEFEEQSNTRDGVGAEFMTVKFPLDVASGRRLVGGIAIDVTARKRVEQALRESEQRYRLLFDVNPQPMWVFDVETLRFLAVNEAAVRHYGYSREEFMAKTVAEIRPEEDVASFRRAVIERHGLTYVNSTGWRHRRKDGTIIDVEITSTAIEFAGRAGRFVLAHDVTERLRAERALLVSRERLDLVLGAAHLGVWFSDLPFLALEWNERCRKHFGMAPSEPVSIETFEARLHPDDREPARQALDRAIETMAAAHLEFRTVDLAGRVRWVRCIGRAYYEPDGHPSRFDAVTIDVTEAKQAEAELLEAKEMAEAANHSKDRFLAVLSHELRTPLTPVLATVTAMLGDPDDPLEIRPTLEMIRRSIELEARLIDDLLDVSRIVHGKLSLDRGTVDVHELIHQTIKICRSDLHGKKMKVEVRLSARRSVVDADPARLQQVLWNLIKNAIKFTPDGGTVTIGSRDAEAKESGEGPRLVVEIGDSGIGIEAEALPRIFDAFEQGERAITRRFGGLGLGLAISRSVVEAHGGTLTADSRGRGQGSTFKLLLLALEGKGVAATNHEPLTAPEPRLLRILLVEDDLNTLRVLSRLLRSRGHEVTTADCVAAAQEQFNGGVFDLLLSDIGLPDGTGIELMRRLGSIRKLRGVALTGFGMDDDIRRCREAGFLAHLTKPVDFGKLEATIQQVASDVA